MSEGPPGATTSEVVSAHAPTPTDHATDLSDRLLKGRIYDRLFPAVPAPTARLGRFVLLRELGHGGMGRVYAAYDEQLDRKVAVKLLHTEVGQDEAARARLLREAQALARLSHPNVVQVHEAGVHEGQVFLVMEHIEGTTLRGWLEARDEGETAGGKRGGRARWRAVLDLMVAAGEGLAAAHEAGLTHRDFKPDNLLVGTDGRVRVVDFGLAAEAGASAGATGDDERMLDGRDDDAVERTDRDADAGASGSSRGETPRPLERLTRTGAAVGTMAYMPLEQLMGGTVDARSDQFSFCATLFEALFGERPFPGNTRAAISVALEDGEPLVPRDATTRAIPRWLRKAIWQGLAKDPAARHADMRALLRALRRRHYRGWVAAGTTTAAVMFGLGLGLGTSAQVSPLPTPLPCAEATAEVDGAWTEEQRTTLGSKIGPNPEASATAVAAIDHWVNDWRDAARKSCEDVHVRHVRAPASLESRGQCLERERWALQDLLAAVDDGTVSTLPMALQWLDELEDPASCLAADAPVKPLSEDQRQQAHRIARELRNAKLAIGEPRLVRRSTRARQLLDEARRLGITASVIDAMLVVGTLEWRNGNATAARTIYGEAVDEATVAGQMGSVVDAWNGLIDVAIDLDFDDEAARFALARARSALGEHSVPRREAALLVRQAHIERLVDDQATAEVLLRRAIEILEAEGPTAAWSLAIALRNLANVLRNRDDREEASAILARAEELERGLSAEEAAEHATQSASLAFAESKDRLSKGDFESAVEQAEVAQWRFAEQYGPRSRRVALTHVLLASIYDATGDLVHTRHHAELADAIYVDIGWADDKARLQSLAALGTVAYREGRFEDAVDAFERAVTIGVRRLSPGSSTRALQLSNLGEAELALGDVDRAREHLERALAVLPEDHGDRAWPTKGLGAVELAVGHFEAARPLLRAALKEFETNREHLPELAETLWLLARVEEGSGDIDAAQALGERAVNEYEGLGTAWRNRTREVRDWINALERRAEPGKQ